MSSSLAAEPAPSSLPCDDAACAAPSFARPPSYSSEIVRGADFSAEVTINQPCRCVRHLGFLVAFTAQGAKTSHERTIKLDVSPGMSTTKVALTNAELAKLKVAPGRYTITYGLYDERGQPAGASVTGQPFTFGTSKEMLTQKPVLPSAIGKDADLAVPFVFSNDGDIASKVTALVVFTRPDEQNGIEIYKKDLLVPPHGKKHVVHVSAAERKKLQIGPGAWLVTVSAFDGSEQRLASYPGYLLTIGKVLSLPSPPSVSASIEQAQDLGVTFTLKNDSDHEDLVTALLIFSGAGAPKPIEYKVEAVHAPPGSSPHTITLTSTDRYNLGIRPGRWHVAASALDRAGKRLETRRGGDVTIAEAQTTAAK